MSPIGLMIEWFGGSAPGTGVRAGAAALAAAAVVVWGGGPLIRLLRNRGAGEAVAKGDAPGLDELMGAKAGTPTCGGFLTLGALCASALLFADWGSPGLWGCLAATLVCGWIGWLDDAAKLRGAAKGISIKFRLAVEGLLGIGIALALAHTLALPEGGVPLAIPGVGAIALPVALFALLCMFTIAGSVNAVNVSDGLDGLASGLTALTAVGLAAGAAAVALPAPAAILGMPPVAGAAEVAVFAAALAGACAGFLWHNCHPARVFMGNVGAAGLGGAIGAVTIAARLEVLLLIAGAVLVAEAGSVILQIASFRLFGRRIFKIAPIHHSFQFRGWHESAVTTRFWLAGAAALAVAASIWPLPA